jgi:hypothetical protein
MEPLVHQAFKAKSAQLVPVVYKAKLALRVQVA